MSLPVSVPAPLIRRRDPTPDNPDPIEIVRGDITAEGLGTSDIAVDRAIAVRINQCARQAKRFRGGALRYWAPYSQSLSVEGWWDLSLSLQIRYRKWHHLSTVARAWELQGRAWCLLQEALNAGT